jgi:SET domain-containing protein
MGVFAKDFIRAGEVFEICPVLDLPINKGESSPLLIDYRFNWPQGENWDTQVISFGFGSLHNHSNDANTYWRSNLKNKTFEFVSIKDIHPGEEIFIWYGDINYWNDGRNHTDII